MTFAAIWEGIVAFLKAIPIFERLFTKTATEKIEDAHEKIDRDNAEEKKTGRPSS